MPDRQLRQLQAVADRLDTARKQGPFGAPVSLWKLLLTESHSAPTEGFDLVAKDLAQRNPKLRDVDTKSIIDLQFVRELEQSGFLKSLKRN